MSEVLELLGDWALTTGATFSILRWDESRLRGARLARAWPPSSKLSAAVLFGPWCLPVHFYRTRFGLRGTVLALAWLGTALSVVAVLAWADAQWKGAGEALDTVFIVACAFAILFAEWRLSRSRARKRARESQGQGRRTRTRQSTLEQGR
jgi:hypothetical protein